MIQNIEKINPSLVMSRVRVKKLPDDVLEEKDEGMKEGLKRLEYYYQSWLALGSWRREREKWARYYNGDQWHEKVLNDAGIYVREEEYISSKGKIPLKQNLIKPIATSIVGQFRSDRGKAVVISRTRDKGKETEMLSNALQSVLDRNDTKELDAAALTEKIISGFPVQKVSWGWLREEKRWDVLIENVNPHFVFFNADVQDVLWRDLRLVGEIIDTTYGKVLQAFGNSPKKAKRIEEIYGRSDKYRYLSNFNGLDTSRVYSLDFYIPDDESKCRVIVAWELKTVRVIMVHDWMDGSLREFEGTMKDVERLNMVRKQKYMEAMPGITEDQIPPIEAWEEYKERWMYGFYSPFGDILEEGESPYWHGSHPYIFAPNHMIDGHLSGLVYDLYDIQRQYNRLKTLQDFMLGTSTKNTLIVDEASLNGQSLEDIADEYVKVGGVIALKLKDGAKPPFELQSGAAHLKMGDMIQFEINLLQTVSGVHPSMQGQMATSGTPASRYAQEAQNSSINLKPLIEPFNTFRKDRNEKALKLVQQFYTEQRWIAVSGSSYRDTAVLYEPEMVRDVEFDMVIAQSADSPVYRNIIDEALKEFLTNGLIDFETYLANTSLPYADTLLETVRNKRQEMAQQQQVAGGQPTQGDPQTMELLQKAMNG